MAVYQPGIPTGTVNLDQDYQNLQQNFQALNEIYSVDHAPYTDQTATEKGYHSVIHLIPSVGAPAIIADRGELYAQKLNDGINNDTELFFQTGGGINIQMTRNFLPVAAARGYSMLPGGLIIQWGMVNLPGSSGTVTFSSGGGIAFPSNIFNVQLTQRRDASASTQGMYLNGAPSATQFSYNGSSSNDNALYWVAIGN